MVELRHGRQLAVVPNGDADMLEICDAAGRLELRVKLTEDGVVLQLEGAHISLKAEQSIDLESRSINLSADADLRIRGGRVFIN